MKDDEEQRSGYESAGDPAECHGAVDLSKYPGEDIPSQGIAGALEKFDNSSAAYCRIGGGGKKKGRQSNEKTDRTIPLPVPDGGHRAGNG